MKRTLSAALAAAVFAAPLALAAPASADRGHHRGHYDRHDDDYDDDDHYRRGDYRDYRDHRDHRRRHWDDRRYNGYYQHGRWYYGPPPVHYRDYHYGYRAWRRGEVLPYYYRQRYRAVDYRHYHVAPPPYGYHYVRNDDSGELLLVGITTGVILGILLAGD